MRESENRVKSYTGGLGRAVRTAGLIFGALRMWIWVLLFLFEHCLRWILVSLLCQREDKGKNQYEKAFGVSSQDLFQALYRSDEEMVKFMHLMNSIWNICGKDVVTAFDLSPFKVICDLGGCSGALAKQCTSAYPECTVTIFDLPKVVRVSREHFVSEADQRISFHEGDFFKDHLPEADLYILARILHDWTDERCIELLRRIYKACKPGGAVLLVEALLNEDGSGPLTAQLYSLNMLVQTEGRERTDVQYAALLAAAGFTNIQHCLTGKIYDAVLGHKET
uniref:Acetylserotonin O-methyltransferase n=1 Tax=Stegastes partitus TaxID=144197 RepID=A0A3B5B0H4_9TELE